MLELRGITKDFPGVRALDNVSVTFAEGEIHALLAKMGLGRVPSSKLLAEFISLIKAKSIITPNTSNSTISTTRLRKGSASSTKRFRWCPKAVLPKISCSIK